MKGKNFAYIIFILVSVRCFSQPLEKHQFVIEGTISGLDSGYLYLNYLPGEENRGIIDNCKIRKHRFRFRGHITEPNKATLSTFNLFNPIYIYDENNITEFYVESAGMKVSVAFNQFASLKLSGSKTDSERVVLEQLRTPVRKLMEPATKVYKAYIDERRVASDSLRRLVINSRLDSLRKVLSVFEKQNWSVDSAFIVANPNSYLAADMLANSDTQIIDFPSLENLYEKLPDDLKISRPGKKIEAELNKEKYIFVGGFAPNFVAPTDRGDTIDLAGYKNHKYILLDFWASWCAPCRQLTPVLAKIYKKHSADLEIIGISFDDKENNWLKAVTEDKATWTQISGNSINFDSKIEGQSIPDLYHINLIPSVILIDKDSRIIEKFGGWYNAKSLSEISKVIDGILPTNAK